MHRLPRWHYVRSGAKPRLQGEQGLDVCVRGAPCFYIDVRHSIDVYFRRTGSRSKDGGKLYSAIPMFRLVLEGSW